MPKAVYFCEDPADDDGHLILSKEMPENYYGFGSIYIPDLPGPHTIQVLMDGEFHDIPLVEESLERISATLEGFGTFYFKVNRDEYEIYHGQKEEYRDVKWFGLWEEDGALLEVACQTYDILFVGSTE